jgi:Tol biopolymer transport system component
MKTISKAPLLSILVITLASCNTFVSKPTMTPAATSLSTFTNTPEPTDTPTNIPIQTLFPPTVISSAPVLPVPSGKPAGRFGIVLTNNFADIYRIPDSTNRKVEQLTYTPNVGEYPLLVSKNGDKIIFEVGLIGGGEEGQQNVYLLNTSSKEMINITNVLAKWAMVPHDFTMDWSPDQKQFAIMTYGGSGSDIKSFIELMNFDGTNKKDIFIPTPKDIPSLIQSAEWSPDGKKFVLMRGVIGLELQLKYPGSAMLVYDLESGNLTQITDYMDGCLATGWSPTSKQIVAICIPSFPYMNESASSLPVTVRIFDVENPGQPYERIVFTACDNPSWSPDGNQIAFVCEKDKKHKGLFVVNSDGDGIHEIELGNLGNPPILYTPIWSPDGTQIVYVAGSDGKHINIYSIHLDGLSNHILTNQSDFYRLVAVYSLP